MIVLGIMLAYLCGALVATRLLFCRWRPTRVCTWRSTSKHICGGYESRCHNRIGADGNRLPFKSDLETIWAAAGTALAWPLVGVALILMRKPPPAPEELKARIAELEKEAGLK